MRLLFRCDASSSIGLGHVARCAALAERLGAALGAEPLFLVRPDPLAVGFLESHSIAHSAVEGPAYGVDEVLAHARGPTSLVSDSYDLVEDDLDAVAAAGIRHLVVDDFGSLSRWPCQVVVNPNLGAEELPYPGAHHVLRGPAFSLLRQEILESSRQRNPSAAPHVLVCLGGGRWPPEATPILRALGSLAADGVAVVAPTAGSVPNGVRAVSPSALAEHLTRAWVAVMSAGVLKYEAAACGVPAVLLSTVEHQHAVGVAFAASGPAAYLGRLDTVPPAEVAETVRRLLADGDERRRMSESGRTLVDGRGAERVASCFSKGLG